MAGEQMQLQDQAPTNDGIRAFDQDGREVMIPREEWRTNVLPGMLQENLNEPDQLYGLIINSLNDGFIAEVAGPAEHLYQTDPVPARGACIWAIVLLQQGRLDEAEKVLNDYLAAHGEESSVLINLAKVAATRDEGSGDNTRRDELLWRGLELEPNHENGMGWLVTMTGEAGGDDAARAALERVRALDGSWRAQLWLARGELLKTNFGLAQDLYREALDRAPRPVPPDLLMQMSGDLGLAGRLQELVGFTQPFYEAQLHGLPVGGNLMKAQVDLGNLDEAARLRDELAAFARLDWQQPLAFWENEITKRRSELGNQAALPQQGIQIGMLRVDGPIWLPPQSPARAVFADKPAGPSVTFLGGSAEAPQTPTQAELKMADALGRMTRALPLYLAEQVDMRTAAHGRAMIPWAVGAEGQPSGFVVSGQRWADVTARAAVQDPANLSEYVVTVHVDAEVEPWEASLVFVRSADGTRIGELQADFDPNHPEQGLPGLADEVVGLLSVLGAGSAQASYEVPEGEIFSSYLLRLEQLLAIRCAAMNGVHAEFLQGEREILDGNLDLCLALPENIPVRILLGETMGALARVKPDAVQAFAEKAAKLQEEHPLAALNAIHATAQP